MLSRGALLLRARLSPARAGLSSAVVSSPAMRWAVGGWTFFIAENLVLSESREHVIDAIGEPRYRLLYGCMSTAACVSIAVGFRRITGAMPLQWAAGASPPRTRLAACFLLQAVGFAGLAQSLPKLQIPFSRPQKDMAIDSGKTDGDSPAQSWTVRCPFDFSKHEGLHGAQRISRNASLWSFAAVCLGAASVVPSVPQAVCLAMPTAVALIGGAHHDSRQRRGMGGHLSAEFDAQTSNIPGIALLSGAQGDPGSAIRAMIHEIKSLNACLGVGCALLFVLRHAR
ncbi:MAG: hypothetical protein SGPRY_003375 [Prymnesium sp.]